MNHFKSVRFSENSLNFSQYSTFEKNHWCAVLSENLWIFTESQTLIDSNLEWGLSDTQERGYGEEGAVQNETCLGIFAIKKNMKVLKALCFVLVFKIS